MNKISKYILFAALLSTTGNSLLNGQIATTLVTTKNNNNIMDRIEINFHVTPMSTSLKTNVFESHTDRKAGLNLGIDAIYYFKEYEKLKLGVSLGFNYSRYNSRLGLNYADSLWTYDADNERILLYEYGSNLNETRNIRSLEIPILFQANYSLSSKVTVYGNIGPYFSLMINSEYYSSMSLTRKAYYPDLNVVLHGIDVKNSPFYYPTDKQVLGKGDLNIKNNMGLHVGYGVRYSASNDVSLNIGLSYYQGLKNISKSNSSEFTLANNEGIINSTVHKSSKTRTNAFGVEFGIIFLPSKLFK